MTDWEHPALKVRRFYRGELVDHRIEPRWRLTVVVCLMAIVVALGAWMVKL